MADDQEFFGGSIERSVDGVAFTAVALVRGVKVPEMSVDMQDITTNDNASRVKTYRPKFADPGELSITCKSNDAGLAAAYADQARTLAGSATHYRVTLPSGARWDFETFPTVTPPEWSEVDDELQFTIKGKCSGEIEFAAA